MNKPATSRIKRISAPLRKSSKKYISLEMLSKMVGLYSDVLADDLEYFEPLIRMDASLNMKDLLPKMDAFIAEEEKDKAVEPKAPRIIARKSEIDLYPNIASFVYQKMTSAGGLVDPSFKLNDHDLHVLQKLVSREVSKRLAEKKKRK
jgi:hypothetical protein